jgi:hypothetical protein
MEVLIGTTKSAIGDPFFFGAKAAMAAERRTHPIHGARKKKETQERSHSLDIEGSVTAPLDLGWA